MRVVAVWTRPAVFLLAALVLITLTACEGVGETTFPDDQNRKRAGGGTAYSKPGSVFGEGGLDFFGGGDAPVGTGEGGAGIGVNSYLWRASLDTISFMPLASADPFGGVIITDWYSPPETQAERFKINLYILGRDLRADGVRAAVFRQHQDLSGNWVDAKVEQKTTIDLENAILTRARQLRVASVQ